jgi:hypothetical protein
MKNQTTYIWIGTIALGGIVGYFIYKSVNKAPEVREYNSDDEQTPTPAPTKTNPFKAMLNKTFPAINFKPTEYSYNNPFADVNTAIADNSLFNIKKDNDFIV